MRVDTVITEPAPALADLDRPLHLVGLPAWLRAVSRLTAGLTVAIGTWVLFGYLVRWRLAVELHPSLPPMYPNTAVAFVIGGLSALLAGSHRPERRRLASGGFAIVALGALATFLLHAVDAGPTVFEALWPDDPFVAATTPVAGRPVVETCVAFIGSSPR